MHAALSWVDAVLRRLLHGAHMYTSLAAGLVVVARRWRRPTSTSLDADLLSSLTCTSHDLAPRRYLLTSLSPSRLLHAVADDVQQTGLVSKTLGKQSPVS